MEWLEFVKQMGDGPFKASLLMAFIHGVRELSKMRKSVEKLNLGMAVVAEKVHGHDRRISNLEKRRK